MFDKILGDWSSPLDHQRNELVFENRNKQYGAYVIRRDYDKSLIYAFVSATFLLIGLLYANTFLTKSVIMKDLRDNTYIIDIPLDLTPPIKDIKPLEPAVKPSHVDPSIIKTPPLTTQGVSIANLMLTEHPVANNVNVVIDGNASPIVPTDPSSNHVVIPSTPITVDPTGANNAIASIQEVGELEIMPTPIGGESEMNKFIRKHIVYPSDALELEKQGKVYIQFVIETDGSVSNVKVIKSIFPSLDLEAARVIKLLPKWNPGISGGKPARVYFRLPINFQLGV